MLYFFKLVLDLNLDESNTTFMRLAEEWNDRENRHEHIRQGAEDVDRLAKGNVQLLKTFINFKVRNIQRSAGYKSYLQETAIPTFL